MVSRKTAGRFGVLGGVSRSVLCLMMFGGVSAAGIGMSNVASAQGADVEPAEAASDSGTAEAPAGSESKELVIQKVVVSARRRDETLQDAPVAITAFTGEALETYAVSGVEDLTKFVPSMVVGRQVTGSSASIFLRGVGSSSLSSGFDQSVSFNLDGLAMSRGREIVFSQYDLERVEVMKGPQALFFGKNTTGGLISLATKNPTEEFEASVKAGYGFNAGETYGEGVVSGALADNLFARLAVRASTIDGMFTNTGVAAVGPDGFNRYPPSDRAGASDSVSGRLTLVWVPSDVLDFNLKLGATDYTDSGAAELYERKCGGGRTVPQPIGGVVDPQADCVVDGHSPHLNILPAVASTLPWGRDGTPYTDLSSSFAILNGTAKFDKFSVNSITGYYEFDQQDANDFTGSPYPVNTLQSSNFNQFSEELRVQTELDGPLNAMLGVFYADSDYVYDVGSYFIQLGPDPVTQSYATFVRYNGFTATTTSAFAELQWNISPQVEFSGGARWTRDERDSYQDNAITHSSVVAVFPPGTQFFDSFSDENVSPQATLRWKPNEDLTFYGAYKEGFKSGGYNVAQTITAAATLESGRYDSETAKGWEAGVRSSLLNGRLNLNATIYDYLYENLQVQRYDPLTAGQAVDNAGELTTRGVEADVQWLSEAIRGLELHGAVAYNDAQYDNFVGQCYAGQTIAEGCDQDLVGAAYTGQVYSGRTPPKAPEWGTRFGGSYDFSVNDALSAQFTVDGNYSSEYNYTDTLRPDGVQDAFTRWDASFSLYSHDRDWKLSLIGRNLTNEYVVTSANDMTFSGGSGTGTASGIVSDLNAVVSRPREVYLELSMEF